MTRHKKPTRIAKPSELKPSKAAKPSESKKDFKPRYSRSTGINRVRRGVAVSKLGQLRRFDYGDDWFKIAKERRNMDGNKCVKCGSTDGLQVHHKTPLSKGGKNNLGNLMTLCDRCHGKEHAHSHRFHGGWKGLGKKNAKSHS